MWGRIYDLVHELDVWMSFGINSWAIITGAIVAFGALSKDHPTKIPYSFISAALLALMVCIAIACGLTGALFVIVALGFLNKDIGDTIFATIIAAIPLYVSFRITRAAYRGKFRIPNKSGSN